MDTEIKKTSRLDKLSERFDHIDDGRSPESMFDYHIVAPYSDARTPKPTRWHESSLVKTRKRRESN